LPTIQKLDLSWAAGLSAEDAAFKLCALQNKDIAHTSVPQILQKGYVALQSWGFKASEEHLISAC